MLDFNKVILTGYIDSSSSLAKDEDGKDFCTGILVTTRSWMSRDRRYHSEQERIRFLAFSDVAYALGHVEQGQIVMLEGKLKTDAKGLLVVMTQFRTFHEYAETHTQG